MRAGHLPAWRVARCASALTRRTHPARPSRGNRSAVVVSRHPRSGVRAAGLQMESFACAPPEGRVRCARTGVRGCVPKALQRGRPNGPVCICTQSHSNLRDERRTRRPSPSLRSIKRRLLDTPALHVLVIVRVKGCGELALVEAPTHGERPVGFVWCAVVCKRSKREACRDGDAGPQKRASIAQVLHRRATPIPCRPASISVSLSSGRVAAIRRRRRKSNGRQD